MNRSIERCQLVVLGGGFAGCLTGMIASRLGYDVVVLERQRHPRFAIGESLTPLANQLLRRLAEQYDLPELIPLSRAGTWREAYPDVMGGTKRGFAYFHHEPGRPFTTDRRHRSELLVAASRSDATADTQWLRSDVDAWFATRARAASVRVLEGADVIDAEREGRQWRIDYQMRDNNARRVLRADFVVHAAGGAETPVDRALNNKTTSRGFATGTAAMWTHLKGLPRFENYLESHGVDTSCYPFRCDDAALHHIIDEGWIWQIRFWDGRTSVGLVVPCRPDDATTKVPDNIESVVSRYPGLTELYREARLAPEPGRWFRSHSLQRRRRFAAAPGVVWLPFAFGFVDPLHSTGIAATLNGIEQVASLLESVRTPGEPIDDARLAAYDRTVQRDLAHVDRLVAAAYLAMHDADLFHAATMAYFAAATEAEWTAQDQPSSADGFLGSTNPRFCRAVESVLHLLRRVARTASSTRIAEAVAAVETALRPFDRVGLFHPAVPRMYSETAAPE